MAFTTNFSATVGRLLIALFFFLSSIKKLIAFQSSQQIFLDAVAHWAPFQHAGFNRSYQSWEWISAAAPWIVVLALLIEALFACFLFFRIRERMAYGLLAVFFFLQTMLMHPFWMQRGDSKEIACIAFAKGCAILGGLLLGFASTSSAATSFSE